MRCKTTRNKGTGRLAVSCILFQEVPSKPKIQCTKRNVFFVWFWLGFHPAWLCQLRTKGDLLNGQNLLSVTKVI